jgi:hypothetical protein
LGYGRNAFLGEEFATIEDIKSNPMADLRMIPKEALSLPPVLPSMA